MCWENRTPLDNDHGVFDRSLLYKLFTGRPLLISHIYYSIEKFVIVKSQNWVFSGYISFGAPNLKTCFYNMSVCVAVCSAVEKKTIGFHKIRCKHINWASMKGF